MKKKRKRLLALVGFLMAIAAGGTAGFLMAKLMDDRGLISSDSGTGAFVWELVPVLAVFLALFYLGAFIHIIVHESGHLIFGMLTGYKFNSFRIGNRILIKSEQGLKWKKIHIRGTGGQCLMDPPDLRDAKMPYILYNLGGVIMNLLVSAVSFGIGLLIWNRHPYGAGCLMEIALLGMVYVLLNGIPAVIGGMPNDGYNIWTMRRSPEALHDFGIQMKINQEVSKGRRLKELPAQWFRLPSDQAMQNPLSATIAVYASNRLMNEHRFEEAGKLMDKLLWSESGMIELHRRLMICDRILCELLEDPNEQILDALLDQKQKKFMKAYGKELLPVIRTQYGLALLREQDTQKGKMLREQFEKRAAVYPYDSDIQCERELMELIDTSFKRQKGLIPGPEKEN